MVGAQNKMTTRADKFLEGFKLGKLGAGNPKLAEDPRKPEKHDNFKILFDHDGKVGGAPGEPPYPHMKWQDPDGWTYQLVLVRPDSNNKEVSILLTGGKEFKLFSKQTLNVVDHQPNYSIAYVKYQMYYKAVKKEKGIDGIFDEVHAHFVSEESGDEPEFERWLHFKLKGQTP
jgi:hypothetical protein